jgi:nucleotide-binding universal stress UspA family protein
MKILIPIDFSENSIKALELASILNRNQRSTIILVHIVELVYDFASQAAIALDSMHKDAKKLMKEIEKKHEKENLEFKHIIKEGTASITIARIAEEKKVDLIVIGSSGAGGLKKLMIGSTTVNLIKETNTPVLVVPAFASIVPSTKLTMALQFSNDEKLKIDAAIDFGQAWNITLEFMHIHTELDFKEELAGLGLKEYLKLNYDLESPSIITSKANSINEALTKHFNAESKSILVMCYQHKTLWEQLTKNSHTLAMTFQSSTPILILI